MKKNVEAAIQRALIKWLRDNYKGITIHATLNEDSRHQVAMGIDVGIPDLQISWTISDIEYIFYHELKTSTGKLSKSQKYWAEKYKKSRSASNNFYAVSYGFEQARENCKRIIPVQLGAV